jgi:integrase
MAGGKGRDGDGIEALGVRKGRRYWRLRLTYIDPRTGKKRDTKRTVQADSLAIARRKRDELLEQVKTARSGLGERKRVSDALDAYFERPMAFSSRSSRESYAKHIRKHMGDWWLDVVTKQDLQAFLDGLQLGTSGASTVRAILRKAFAVAEKKGWVAESVAERLEGRDDSIERATASALGKAPKRALTPDEAVLFLADLRGHSPLLYPVVATQYVLGCRFAEVSALAPGDVDLESGLVEIRRGQVEGRLGPTKGKYARLAGLPLTLRAELKQYRAMVVEQEWPGHAEFFFPRPPGGWRRHSNAWSIATAGDHIRASFDRLKLSHMKAVTHAARHTMISLAAIDQANEQVLRKVVGHSSGRLTSGYTTAFKDNVIELAERTAAQLTSKKQGPG